MPRDPLEKSLADLAKAIERAEPAKPEPLTVRTTPVRDSEHRVTHSIIEMSDGRRFKKTPVRDAEHRLISSVTVELPPDEAD